MHQCDRAGVRGQVQRVAGADATAAGRRPRRTAGRSPRPARRPARPAAASGSPIATRTNGGEYTRPFTSSVLPTHFTAVVAMTRWPMTLTARAPPARSPLSAACTSCWCTTRSSGVGGGTPAGSGRPRADRGASSSATVRPGPLAAGRPASAPSLASLAARLLQRGVARCRGRRLARRPACAARWPGDPAWPRRPAGRRRAPADHRADQGVGRRARSPPRSRQAAPPPRTPPGPGRETCGRADSLPPVGWACWITKPPACAVTLP